jgi:hypothetical protein
VFENAFPRLERQIESVQAGISRLEMIDDTKRLQIVLEAAIVTHAPVKSVLAGVTERRMAEIVGKTDGLDEILIEVHGSSDGACDLRHFKGVSEAGPVQIPFMIDEDLCLVDQSPESGRVNHPIAIPLELAAPDR